MSELYEIIFVN